jgi:hypothetical protein
MFRISIIALILVGAISLGATVIGAPEKRKPNNWQPIIGFKIAGAKAFFDANSVTTNVTESGNKFNSAEILVSYDSPTEVTVAGKKFVVRSMARQMIVECNTGLSAPVFDVFFKESIPSRQSMPLTGIEWPSNTSTTYSVLPRKSILYHTLCPISI